MKKIIFLLFICVAFSNTILFAQNSLHGIYLSANDFSNNKISFTPIQGKKYKLQLNEFLNKPTIKITIGDSTYFLNKDSVFGYRDKENIVHRFYEENIFSILNPTENILLYSKTSLGGYKNSQSIINYYFSANAHAALQPLTKWNLKNSFSNDSAFHELLDMEFSSDNDLHNYDSFYKIYKLNRVFQFSQQLILKSK